MKCKFYKIKVIYFILIIIQFLFSCEFKTEERIDKTSQTFPNGKHIIVEKLNKESTSTGILTNINYGTSHSFKYQFTLTEDNIKWDGGSSEPKNIIFCKDAIYIRYLKEKSLNTTVIDSSDTIIENNTYEVKEFFQKHIDRRYFLKIFGDDFWEDISSENYYSMKNSCGELFIPNDGELFMVAEVSD